MNEVKVMTNVNLIEAGSDLSKLIKMLENKEEDIIYIIQNGVRVAQLTAVPKKMSSKRIGVAAGKFTVPEDFDDMDKDIEELFEDYL